MRGGRGSGSANIFLTSQTPPSSGGGLWIKTNLKKFIFNNSIQPGLTATLLQLPRGYVYSYSNYNVQLYEYDDNNILNIEMGSIKAPSTSQASSYPRATFTTYNIPAQTTTVWTYTYIDDDGYRRTANRIIDTNNVPYIFSTGTSGLTFETTYSTTSGRTSYLRYNVNISTNTPISTVVNNVYTGFCYFQEGNINYLPLSTSTNYIVIYNTSTLTATTTSSYGSFLSRQAIIKNGNNIYCLGCGSDNAMYSLTSYTWTALPSFGPRGAGSGYVFRDNLCYFRNNNQIIAFNLNTNTFTVTNTIDSYTSTTSEFMGWCNWKNNYLYCPKLKFYSANQGLYRFTVAGTVGSSDTVYVTTGGNKNFANIVSGQSGVASVPIQGVYTVVNGVLTPYSEAYVSTGGTWTRVVY